MQVFGFVIGILKKATALRSFDTTFYGYLEIEYVSVVGRVEQVHVP